MFGGRRRGGLVRTVGRTAAIAGTASVVSGRVSRRQQRRWSGQEQQQVAAQQMAYDQGQADAMVQPAPASTAASEDDVMSQLERLGKLKEQGIVTDEEFAAEKAKILAG